MARSAEGARAWSDLSVPDTPDEQIQAENRTSSLDFSPDNVVVGNKTVIQNSAEVQNNAEVQNSAGTQNNAEVQNHAGTQNNTGVENSAGTQNNAGVQNNTGTQNNARVQNSTGAQNSAGTQVPQNQRKVTMAGPKEKLPKFHGDGSTDPIRHCKTCEHIWTENGVTDEDDWVRQFPATLRGVVIDWFSDTSPQKLNTWENLKKEFIAEFKLLRDDNEIVAEIYSTKQGKNETVRTYARRLKELIGKMESQPADGLKKRWFVEGLRLALKKKMKIVPPASYADAYTRAMDLESE